MPKDIKRGDVVASPRKTGQQAQDEFTNHITHLVKNLESVIQLEVEPNVNTLINIYFRLPI
mgnify:CR=1 FL=1